MYVIEILNSGKKCWVAGWEGDPPRTVVLENAQIFKSKKQANKRIEECKETHPFRRMIYEIRIYI